MFEVEGTLWFIIPEGELSVGIDGLQGTSVDLEADLGYDEVESVPALRFIMGETHQLGFSGFKIEASAQNIVNKTIYYYDEAFQVNEEVFSSFDITTIQIFYRYNIGPEIFHGGILAGGEYFTADASAYTTSQDKATVSLDTGMFLLGAFAETNPLPFLRMRAALMGGAFDVGDVEARYLDFEFSALAKIPPGFHLGAGYRYIGIDAEDSRFPLEIDLAFKGPFIFAGFEW